MRVTKRHIFILISGIFCLWFFISGIVYANKMYQYNELITLVNLDASITGEGASQLQRDNMKKDQQLSFVLWDSLENQKIENPEFKRDDDVEVITANGRTDLLFPNEPYLDFNDTGGCLLGKEAAIKLFGSSDVKDLTVDYNEKTYIVRGVLMGVQNVFVCQSNEPEYERFNRLTALRGEYDSPNGMVQKISTQLEITGQRTEYETFFSMTEIFLFLIPVLLAVWLVLKLRSYYKQAESRKEKFIWLGVCTAAVTLICVALFTNFTFTLDINPPMWSDFDYWQAWIEQRQDALTVFLKAEKSTPEILYIFYFLQSFFCNLLAVFAVIFCAVQIKWVTCEELFEQDKTWFNLSKPSGKAFLKLFRKKNLKSKAGAKRKGR